jgi:hypothetical protein
MKIDTNIVGNYSPSTVRRTPQTGDVKLKAEVLIPQKKDEKISEDEKEYFAAMYPEKQAEIFDHSYGRNGKLTGAHVGSLYNKRG